MKQFFNYLIFYFILHSAVELNAQSYSKELLSTIKSANSSTKFIMNFANSSPIILKDVESNIFSTHFAPKPFDLNLNTLSFAYARSFDSDFFVGVGFCGVGNPEFQDLSTDIIFGYDLNDMFIAAKVNYSMFRPSGFNDYNNVNLGLAVSYKIGKSLYAATYIDRIELYDQYPTDKLEYIESISGLSYLIDKNTAVEVDYHLLTNLFSSFSFGFKHHFSEEIGFSFAYQTVVNEIDIVGLLNIYESYYLVLNYNYQSELGHKKIITLSYTW